MIFVLVSTGHFDPLIEECVRLSSQYNFVGQIGSSRIVPPFEHFRTGTPQKLESYMKKAEMVVTHAGTGMLSMVYGLRKPHIVIPKQIRYGEANDGQVELAEKWAKLGMAILCMNVRDLGASIEKCRKTPLQYPPIPSLGKHLRSELDRVVFRPYATPHLAKETP